MHDHQTGRVGAGGLSQPLLDGGAGHIRAELEVGEECVSPQRFRSPPAGYNSVPSVRWRRQLGVGPAECAPQALGDRDPQPHEPIVRPLVPLHVKRRCGPEPVLELSDAAINHSRSLEVEQATPGIAGSDEGSVDELELCEGVLRPRGAPKNRVSRDPLEPLGHVGQLWRLTEVRRLEPHEERRAAASACGPAQVDSIEAAGEGSAVAHLFRRDAPAQLNLLDVDSMRSKAGAQVGEDLANQQVAFLAHVTERRRDEDHVPAQFRRTNVHRPGLRSGMPATGMESQVSDGGRRSAATVAIDLDVGNALLIDGMLLRLGPPRTEAMERSRRDLRSAPLGYPFR